jgi:hypothetical protein
VPANGSIKLLLLRSSAFYLGILSRADSFAAQENNKLGKLYPRFVRPPGVRLQSAYAENRTFRKSVITRVVSETALYQRLRRIRGCSGEVASHVFWQTTRVGLGGFSHLAKPASVRVRTWRSASLSLIPLQFGSRVFS